MCFENPILLGEAGGVSRGAGGCLLFRDPSSPSLREAMRRCHGVSLGGCGGDSAGSRDRSSGGDSVCAAGVEGVGLLRRSSAREDVAAWYRTDTWSALWVQGKRGVGPEVTGRLKVEQYLLARLSSQGTGPCRVTRPGPAGGRCQHCPTAGGQAVRTPAFISGLRDPIKPLLIRQ